MGENAVTTTLSAGGFTARPVHAMPASDVRLGLGVSPASVIGEVGAGVEPVGRVDHLVAARDGDAAVGIPAVALAGRVARVTRARGHPPTP